MSSLWDRNFYCALQIILLIFHGKKHGSVGLPPILWWKLSKCWPLSLFKRHLSNHGLVGGVGAVENDAYIAVIFVLFRQKLLGGAFGKTRRLAAEDLGWEKTSDTVPSSATAPFSRIATLSHTRSTALIWWVMIMTEMPVFLFIVCTRSRMEFVVLGSRRWLPRRKGEPWARWQGRVQWPPSAADRPKAEPDRPWPFRQAPSSRSSAAFFLASALGTPSSSRGKHVFKAVFLHKQIKALKNHGYFSSCLPELLFSEAAHVDAVENNVSGRWPLKHIYASHEGAFPAPLMPIMP